MSILGKIWNFIKTGVKKVFEFFKDKNPVEVVDDVSKAAIGAATIAAVGFAAVNVVKSLFMSGKKHSKKSSDNYSGADAVLNMRVAGTADEKLAELRRNSGKMSGKYTGLTQEEVEMLQEISKTRNEVFRSMPPMEQIRVLNIEGFDFDAFKEKMRRESKKGRIRKSSRRVGEKSPPDKAFREPVDYGWLNFIMRPLDDFICWLRNDPTPKQVEQIHLINREEIPDVSIEALGSLNSYFDVINTNSDESGAMIGQFSSIQSMEERQICADEIFKHKNLRDFQKAVSARMVNMENGLSSQIFDLMDKDMKTRKKKDGGKKKKSDGKIHFYGDSGKKKNKGDKALESDADAEAADIYNHFLKKALKGEETHKGYHLDRIL